MIDDIKNAFNDLTNEEFLTVLDHWWAANPEKFKKTLDHWWGDNRVDTKELHKNED